MAAFFRVFFRSLSCYAQVGGHKKIPSLGKAGEGNKGILLTERGIYIPRAFFACTDTAFSGSSSISFSR